MIIFSPCIQFYELPDFWVILSLLSRMFGSHWRNFSSRFLGSCGMSLTSFRPLTSQQCVTYVTSMFQAKPPGRTVPSYNCHQSLTLNSSPMFSPFLTNEFLRTTSSPCTSFISFQNDESHFIVLHALL